MGVSISQCLHDIGFSLPFQAPILARAIHLSEPKLFVSNEFCSDRACIWS